MLATECPMCGSKFNVATVGIIQTGEYWRLAGRNEEGYPCCSWNCFLFKTQELAEAAAKNWTADDVAEYAAEREEEAMAVTDEHGYFMDCGAADSDPYDY